MKKSLLGYRLPALICLLLLSMQITGCSVIPAPNPTATPMRRPAAVLPSPTVQPSPTPTPWPSAEAVLQAYFDAWANKDADAMHTMYLTQRNVYFDFEKLKSVKLLGMELQTAQGESPAIFLTEIAIESTDGIAVAGFSDGIYSDYQFILEREDENSPWRIVDFGY